MSVAETSPLAGKPAPASMLVNVPRLVTAYYAEHPDPSVAAERVAFGTSGHRGSAFDAHVQRGAHPGDHPGDLPLSPGARHRWSAVHRHGHPRAVRAGLRQRPRGAGRQRRRGDDRPRPRLHADAGHLARHPSLQPRPHLRAWPTASSSRRRTIRRKTAASSTTRPTAGRPDTDVTGWIEQTANALLADGLRAVRRMPYERALPRLDHAPARLHHAVRRRSRERDRHGGHPRRRRAHRRGSARRRGRALLGPIIERYGIAATVVNDASIRRSAS